MAEETPSGSGSAPSVDGRIWGITTKSTPGTHGPSGNVQGNSKGGTFK